jgi:hypothetical protein
MLTFIIVLDTQMHSIYWAANPFLFTTAKLNNFST